ncbi:MAG: chromosomal replication initiator protein DnaA [Patescibacteria group bacterium]|nr:chromosomal replication initiator protein DnaA [Patescibacteria group bacterium]
MNNHELSKEKLWQTILGEMELQVSRANFVTWFKNARISSIEDNGETIIISLPNEFTKVWFEKKYHKKIFEILQNITQNKVKQIIYKIESVPPPAPKEKFVSLEEIIQKEKVEPKISIDERGLNPRYTFENFIVGKGNELAHAACLAVSQNPGKKYNPLFIYGGVGLGKTHLLQAIGHEVLKRNKNKKVLYVSAERFMNDFVKAIREGKIDLFKKNYRQPDVFLIDDVQFFAGKNGVQEEFFHTFNTLHQRDSQIVLTSDRPPRVIPAIEERLISRFEGGMIVDISPPDLETRIAILEQKAKERGYTLPREILQQIAVQIQSNVRQLEGALNKVIAYHELNKLPFSLEETKKIVTNLVATPRRAALSPRELLQIVAEFYGLKVNELLSRSRKKELVVPRQVAMFLMREELDTSFPLIGHEFGGKDHTTAMHAWRKIKKKVEEEGRIKQEIDFIRQRIYNR